MRVSIITPSFNQAHFIEATIESIISQTYRDYEHIIMDGASTDGTVEILKSYPHLKWVSEKDRGQSHAINKGFRQATGEIWAWQNSDDTYEPQAFETVVKFFQDHPEVGMVYGDYHTIDEHGEWLFTVHPPEWDFSRFIHGRFCPLQPATFWRADVARDVGEIEEELHWVMDIDFFARIAKKYRVAHIPEVLGSFRIHAAAKSAVRTTEEDRMIMRRYTSGTLWDDLLFTYYTQRRRLGRFAKRYLLRR